MENRKREWKEYSSSVGLNDTGKAVKNQAKTREKKEAFTQHWVTLEVNTPWPAEG